MNRSVVVDLGQRAYTIHIGNSLIGDVMKYVPSDLREEILFILTDRYARPYADKLLAALKQTSGAADVHLLEVPAGEETKSFLWYEKVLDWMLDHGVTRKSVLFTVGGGVIGDLGGFAAATVLRGIQFVQIPTTLLAQVDSSIGGKTAINTIHGKNMVGVFYQPMAVLCDLDTLSTLDDRQRRAGYAEILKYGMIGDVEFFQWMENHGEAVCRLDPDKLSYAIEVACRKKAEAVAMDERESDTRMLLNFGHTFAHALEAAAGYTGTLLHGEAVAVGMVLAIQLSMRLGLCGDEPLWRLREHLKSIGLPASVKAIQNAGPFSADMLIRTMYSDKKAEAGGLTFILIRKIGDVFIQRRVEESDVAVILDQSIND